MPKPLHPKKDLRQYSQGSNFDDNSEFIGSSDAGEDITCVNMRHDEFDKDSKTKIGGELLLYPAINNACFLSAPYTALDSSYECIGKKAYFLEDDQLDHIIEFWASPVAGHDAFVRIDGIVVLMSPDFPLTYNHPLQIAINLNCVGGEIYITDYNVSPLIFNLKDLMVNGGFQFDGISVCTQKYFSGFNIDEYTLETSGDNNHPIFIQITSVLPSTAEAIGGGRNDVGLYTYQIRKSTVAGDKTGWSKATPQIPIVLNYNNASAQYPYTKTYGADPAVKSTLGVHIRFRVDNALGYDYLEIKRTKYTLGSAPGTPGVEKLLDYKLQLQPNDLYVKDVWDIGALELPLNDQAASNSLAAIKRAKAIRYYNMRLTLMNIEYESRDLSVDFTENGAGKRMFPVIQKMTTATRLDGHKNPFNFAYYRSLPRGEKYGWAAEFRDGNNQVSFAIPIPKNTALTEDYQNYQMPNRRDVVSTETDRFSNATVKAATTDGATGLLSPVLQTHEVFDLVDGTPKNSSSPKNVLASFTMPPMVPPSVPPNIIVPIAVPYSPLTPTSQNDGDVSGHSYVINDSVVRGRAADISPALTNYRPYGFGPNYYALGMAINAIKNIPSYIKSISIVRTKPAKRVVAQGIGYYALFNPLSDENVLNINSKSVSGFTFYSPDFESGIANFQDILDSVARGEHRYKVQLVSPLGFFSEVYAAYSDGSITTHPHNGMDMINYIRVLRDNGVTGPGGINPGESVPSPFTGNGMGFSPNVADGFGYVGFGKWRGHSYPTGTFPNGSGGNQLFDIVSIPAVSSTRSNRTPLYFLNVGANPVYRFSDPPNGQTWDQMSFDDASTREWQEPMYVLNIIDTLAQVESGNIQNYIETESYQKTEAKIGASTGSQRQEYLTVDERVEDFQIAAGGANKIIFTKLNGVQKAWHNVDLISPAALLGVVNSINNGTFNIIFNGVTYNVGGIYKTTTTALTDTYNETRIVFDASFNPSPGLYPSTIFVPDADSSIIIKYNTDEPLKSFGGEVVIHEAVFSPFDIRHQPDGSTDGSENFHLSIPFPYNGFNLNDSYLYPDDVQSDNPDLEFHVGGLVRLGEQISFSPFIQNSYAKIRQILAMFTCESRIGLPYDFEIQGSASQTKFFPATHYIMRPFKWDPSLSPENQNAGFYPAYNTSYPGEKNLWNYGGFRFRPQSNLDYSAQDETHTAVSKPKVGFREETLFCTGIIYSLQRPPNTVDAPGLRTFPATNFFVIEDDTGDIKYAYDDFNDGKGSNLYAITENGVYWLITDKTILSTFTGDQLAAIGSTGGNPFISLYLPISKTIGMNDEMWRSAAEGYNVVNGDLSHRRLEALFFSNHISQYRLSSGQLFDIARGGKYHSKVFPEYLSRISPGYGSLVSSVYDILHDEYWMCAKRVHNPPHNTVVYAEKKSHYEGLYDYIFDQFVSLKGNTYGMRNAETYILNQYGSQINGQDIESSLVGVSAKELPSSKEFSRIRISSNEKPDNIKVYNSKDDFIQNQFNYSEIDTNTLPLSLKDYGAWTGFIPRKANPPRNRNQGRECIFVVNKTGNTKFKIVTIEIGYQLLK